MFNSMYNHLTYTKYIDLPLVIDDAVNLGGSEHVALFADDMFKLKESSVESQRMPIIVKNVPNNAPMGNTVVPLYDVGYFYGPDEFDLSGYASDPPESIDYSDVLIDMILNSYGSHSSHVSIRGVYLFPDQHTILYCTAGIDLDDNSYGTSDLTVKLAVATQNAITGEIVDEQLFSLPTITNQIIDMAFSNFYDYQYGFRILGSNYYCMFLPYAWHGDLRICSFVIIKAERIDMDGKSWQVLRAPQLFVRSQVKHNFKNWIAHIVTNNQTYVCVSSDMTSSLGPLSDAVLVINASTNTISHYICNYRL